MDKDSKEARNKRILAMWMACHTQEEIGEKEDCDQKTITNVLGKMADLPKLLKPQKAAAEHATKFNSHGTCGWIAGRSKT